MSLSGLILLTGCSKGDEGEKPLELVNTQFNFSLPLKKAGALARTRMDGDVVQVDESEEKFRGMEEVRLLCYDTNTVPSETASKLGNIIEIKTEGKDVNQEVTEDDYSICQEIRIPVGTSYFGFYAKAQDDVDLSTHENKMKYGIIETVGLGKNSYQDNSTVRFKPVSICTSDASFGGSAKGQALLDLLNDLMGTTVAVAAPNNLWSTTDNVYLNEAYQRMTQLKALSSEHVQIMLAAINRIINYEPPYPYDNPAGELAAAITAKIAGYCKEAPTAEAATVELKDEYQGYPDDLHLPTGSARVEWDEEQGKFVEPDTHAYGDNITISALSDYVYPMNLQYQIFSDILASDNLVVNSEDNPGTTQQYEDWDDLIDNGYQGASKSVQITTQSVAMVKQVEYAVGRMALRVRMASRYVNDAKNQVVDALGAFTLKGYLVGGQREVDYNFQPVTGSKTYAIYDSYMTGSTQAVKPGDWTEPSYILGLGTESNQKVNLALELVNNGNDFYGADGVIAHGATFYVVAELDPSQGGTTDLSKIFDRDYATQVNLTIKSLATATYGLPCLDIPILTVAVSVNLSWEEGLWFDDIEL